MTAVAGALITDQMMCDARPSPCWVLLAVSLFDGAVQLRFGSGTESIMSPVERTMRIRQRRLSTNLLL